VQAAQPRGFTPLAAVPGRSLGPMNNNSNSVMGNLQQIWGEQQQQLCLRHTASSSGGCGQQEQRRCHQYKRLPGRQPQSSEPPWRPENLAIRLGTSGDGLATDAACSTPRRLCSVQHNISTWLDLTPLLACVDMSSLPPCAAAADGTGADSGELLICRVVWTNKTQHEMSPCLPLLVRVAVPCCWEDSSNQ